MRFTLTMLVVVALGLTLAVPATAADPQASKRVMTDADGSSVVLINVVATSREIYAISIADASSSIEDIIAPNGWVGISSGDRVLFRTGDSPITPGSSVTFRLVTKNSNASLGVVFSDAKTAFAKTTL